MYQKFIPLSEDSYIEITTRLFDGDEKVVVALRGTKADTSPALASVVITSSKLDELISTLQEAKITQQV